MNVNVGFNSSSGGYYNVTTGLDNNGDLMFNDRPAGVSRNSAQVPVWNVGLRMWLSYSFTFGKSATSAPPGIMITSDRGGALTVAQAPTSAAGRYRISISVNANNITNRNNYGGYIGNLSNLAGFGQTDVVRRAAADQPRDVVRVLTADLGRDIAPGSSL